MSQPNKWDRGYAAQSRAIIFGCAGLTLQDDERAFFKETQPLGFILFARNIDTPDQVKALVQNLKDTVGWNCPILIDQEGGRVARLRHPHWPEHPPFKVYGDLYRDDAEKGLTSLKENLAAQSKMLVDLGINVNCTPVLDVPVQGAHDIIGDRAFANDPQTVAELGAEACKIVCANGITPIIKHIPGHGRAMSDSHEDLAVVDTDLITLEQSDFFPFTKCAHHGAWGMTAHVIFKALDPDLPVTLSPQALHFVRNNISFDGFLLGDDVFMKALDPYGNLEMRVAKQLSAGIDAALFCHGDVATMEQGAKGAPILSETSLERLCG